VRDWLVAHFPGLAAVEHRITSPESDHYNCIAWAASTNDRWWWPHADAFWPPTAPMSSTIEAFAAAYATLGYELCVGPDFQPKYEKIAVYADHASLPQHAARQLLNGKWTSKLGPNVDIQHATLEALAGDHYGTPTLYMRRYRPVWQWPLGWFYYAWIRFCPGTGTTTRTRQPY
jgi:hypothetical protein